MFIIVVPCYYHSTQDNNEPNTEYILRTRDEKHLNLLSTHFEISESTASHFLSDGSKKIKALKCVNLFWCTIKKRGGFTKITPTVKYDVCDWIINNHGIKRII